MDRLAGAALAVSKAELGERIQQQSRFEMQADELKARVARVRTHASKAVENSRHASKVRTVRVTGDFIDRLTPQVIAAARALAGEITLCLLNCYRGNTVVTSLRSFPSIALRIPTAGRSWR